MNKIIIPQSNTNDEYVFISEWKIDNNVFVNKGDHVKKGEIIATVGSSGRSTGPHLDVRLNWFGTRLDPATILDIQQ